MNDSIVLHLLDDFYLLDHMIFVLVPRHMVAGWWGVRCEHPRDRSPLRVLRASAFRAQPAYHLGPRVLNAEARSTGACN